MKKKNSPIQVHATEGAKPKYNATKPVFTIHMISHVQPFSVYAEESGASCFQYC